MSLLTRLQSAVRTTTEVFSRRRATGRSGRLEGAPPSNRPQTRGLNSEMPPMPMRSSQPACIFPDITLTSRRSLRSFDAWEQSVI